jgi:hypothetical protein
LKRARFEFLPQLVELIGEFADAMVQPLFIRLLKICRFLGAGRFFGNPGGHARRLTAPSMPPASALLTRLLCSRSPSLRRNLDLALPPASSSKNHTEPFLVLALVLLLGFIFYTSFLP